MCWWLLLFFILSFPHSHISSMINIYFVPISILHCINYCGWMKKKISVVYGKILFFSAHVLRMNFTTLSVIVWIYPVLTCFAFICSSCSYYLKSLPSYLYFEHSTQILFFPWDFISSLFPLSCHNKIWFLSHELQWRTSKMHYYSYYFRWNELGHWGNSINISLELSARWKLVVFI